MITRAVNILALAARPLTAGGPIFTKDLFVTSRRRRYYLLRVVYVAAMTVLVAATWRSVVGIGGVGYGASRMAEAGKSITAAIAWGQFIATQVLAMVLLSTAISEELHSRTLPMLMTTPLGGRQIVAGKLFAKLLHLLILLAISFPILAIVRVLGGVPWDFVIASLSITISAMILTGAVSLFHSISRPQPASVIFRVLCLHVVWGVITAVLYRMSVFAGPDVVAAGHPVDKTQRVIRLRSLLPKALLDRLGDLEDSHDTYDLKLRWV